jgi:hypothetical protein
MGLGELEREQMKGASYVLLGRYNTRIQAPACVMERRPEDFGHHAGRPGLRAGPRPDERGTTRDCSRLIICSHPVPLNPLHWLPLIHYSDTSPFMLSHYSLNDTNPQVEDGAKGVTVGNTIAIIGEEGDDPAGAEALANESSSTSSSSESKSDSSSSAEKSSKTGDSQPTSSEASSGESKSSSSPQKDDSTRKDNSKHTPALGTPADEKKYGSGGGSEEMKAPEKGGDKPKFFASPLARKIALEKGVPLGKVKGTGPEGRITEVSLWSLAPFFVFGYHRRNYCVLLSSFTTFP